MNKKAPETPDSQTYTGPSDLAVVGCRSWPPGGYLDEKAAIIVEVCRYKKLTFLQLIAWLAKEWNVGERGAEASLGRWGRGGRKPSKKAEARAAFLERVLAEARAATTSGSAST